MNRCLACNEQCPTNSLFCDECRSRFINRFQSHQKIEQPVSQVTELEPYNLASREQVLSHHHQHLPQNAVVDHSPNDNSTIQYPTIPETEQEKDLSYLLPDAWPELENSAMYEVQPDAHIEQSDPLMARHLPFSPNELAQDWQHEAESVVPEQQANQFIPFSQFHHTVNIFMRKRTMRIAIILLAVIVVLALIADIVLASMNIAHHTTLATTSSLPLIIVTPTIAHPGQIVLLRINHFPALTDVFLTHDVQEAVRTDTGSPLLQVGPSGSIEVHILVENTWGAGIHTIDAEGVTTHYIASAILQITGNGQIQPPRLALSQTVFNMGSDVQGTNTIQPLALRNAGGNTISWFADSHQPWLFTAPTQGVFSDSQNISIAITRANLSPGTYKGSLSLHWNASNAVTIQITMTVLPFVKQKAIILTAVAPALSFMAVDGSASPGDQIVMVSNPGMQPLKWDTTSNPPSVPFNQAMSYIPNTNWLQTVPSAGTIAPGATAQVRVMVHSQSLLPSAYSLLLHFSYSHKTTAPFQPVAISLTVQPRCGVVASMGVMSFSLVAGASNPHNSNTQSLGLSTTSDCLGVTNWQASTSASWLTMTPTRGQLQDDANVVTTVGVQGKALQPGSYTSFIVFVAGQRTQTVLVQLNVLPSSSSPTGMQFPGQIPSGTGTAPAGTSTPAQGGTAIPQPGAPALNISSQNLNFNATQGQGNPPGQNETIVNSGSSTLNWQLSFDSGAAFWLSLTPTSGSIAASQSTQLAVHINTNGLSSGTYSAQVTVTATDSSGAQVSGSPQFFTVTIRVLQPCVLQITPNNVAFSVVLLNPNPPDQRVVLSESGNCARPVSWTAAVDANSTTWLGVNNSSGQDNGSGSPIEIHVNTQGMIVGKYTGYITIYAYGNGGAPVQSSPQTVTVTLSVLQL
ncbi:MAG: BACON domain-containing protein [Ktedonobacteraceae bacterium]